MAGTFTMQGLGLDWYQIFFDLIGAPSFSTLWFWIVLAVMWTMVSHWVLGVPYDLVLRAPQSEAAARDLDDAVRVHVNRLLHIGERSGLWLLGFACFVLSALALLGFLYGLEMAQALFLLGFPMVLVWLLSHWTAARIAEDGLRGADLYRRLAWHRMLVQGLGLVSVFATALWGMYQNLLTGPLGG